jgi:GDP-4-dehydro-6-deoxy-D-mannose reductase
MKVLVTGVAGFVGVHLSRFLLAERSPMEVFGIVRPGAPRKRVPEGVQILDADLEEGPQVEAVLDRVHPDRIVHLAAQSSPQDSWADPEGTLRTNVVGLLHLLEGVRRRRLSPRILVVGSAEEYGLVDPRDLPVSEDAPLRPATPYAVSKIAQGYLALQYTLAFSLGIVRTRTFHHTGPGRGPSFAESAFARQIVDVELGRRPPLIEVGNLEAVRDFSDARDVVRAYWALLEHGNAGEVYNVCSGQGIRIRDVLEKLIRASGVKVEVRVDPERLRPADVAALVGDPARLRARTGWEPRLSIDQSLADLLQYWRERSASEAAVAPPARGTS